MVITIDKNNSDDLIKLTRNDGKMLFVDTAAIKAGKSTNLLLQKGETATLQYPSYPQLLQYCGTVRTRNNVLENVTEWTKIDEST